MPLPAPGPPRTKITNGFTDAITFLANDRARLTKLLINEWVWLFALCDHTHVMGSCFSTDKPRPKSKSVPPPLQLILDEEAHSENQPNQIPKEKLLSLVTCQLYDDPNPPQCPYCERPNSDKADMIICNSPTIPYNLFQTLMVRGWWRTGNVIFKPQVESICCPSYAIRMSVAEYKLTKSHRKVLNKWRNFLLNGDPRWENRRDRTSPVLSGNGSLSDQVTVSDSNDEAMVLGNRDLNETGEAKDSLSSIADTKPKHSKVVRKGDGPDPTKPPCKKAKELRAERRKRKTAKLEKDVGNAEQNNEGVNKKSLLELLEEHERELEASSDAKHKLEIKLLPRNDPEVLSSLRDFFDLYNHFQDAVHPGKSKFKSVADIKWGFVDSPLEPAPRGSRPLGTYHMKYYLDGELIMLSLLDILPEYLVSIYFIYDPNIRFLQPGIYTCLQEIALIQRLQKSSPELRYYNLGFYNDFSPKINYKRQFKPTEILCPVTGTYVPLEHAIPLLKQNKFCKFAEDSAPERPKCSEIDVDDVIVFHHQSGYTNFRHLPSLAKHKMRHVLQQYSREAGSDVIKQMILSQ